MGETQPNLTSVAGEKLMPQEVHQLPRVELRFKTGQIPSSQEPSVEGGARLRLDLGVLG